jgi:hypothetical protein
MSQRHFAPLGERLDEAKTRLNILILGSYRSIGRKATPCLKRLERLRTHLNSIGYENAKLVKDFPDDVIFHKKKSVHFEVKSKERIRNWATGLIFVFLRGCNNVGVACELTYVDDKVPDFFHSSAVLVEKGERLSVHVTGPLERHGIEGSSFEEDDELFEFAEGACSTILWRNYSQV